MCILMSADEIIIPACGGVPALVLDKGIITPQIHCHMRAANRAFGDQLRGYFHILLPRDHLAHYFLIVIGFVVAGFGALPQTVISLRVKKIFRFLT